MRDFDSMSLEQRLSNRSVIQSDLNCYVICGRYNRESWDRYSDVNMIKEISRYFFKLYIKPYYYKIKKRRN
ncbi:hypothetical protein J4471_02050 [Candidatus Woesearchaeota archaeon]|nr:hypothetical protein [Candidatus Woesearchaeota archaeon]